MTSRARDLLRRTAYGMLFGAGVAALSWLWRYDAPPPGMAGDLAAAAGLRPPESPVSGLWLAVAAPLFGRLGVRGAFAALGVMGHVGIGLLAFIACDLFRSVLPSTIRRGEHIARWWRAVVRFVILQAAVFFCLSQPVWTAFRWFSPLALDVLLAASTVSGFLYHWRTRRRWPLFLCASFAGLLSSDTPVGAVLAILAVLALRVRAFMEADQLRTDSAPLAGWRSTCHLTLVFLVFSGVGTVLSAAAFAAAGGLDAFGWTWGDYALETPLRYIGSLLASCTPTGVVLFLAFAVLPVVVCTELLRRASNDEKFLPYMHGIAFSVFALVALAQFSGAKSLWFWMWGGGARISDGLIRCIAMFLCAVTAAWALAVFAIDLFLRNFRRIAALQHPDVPQTTAETERALMFARRANRFVRACFLLEPVVALVCIVPFRAATTERAMLSVVTDAAEEVARECRGVERVFTDGGIDAMIELAAALEGRTLRAVSLLGGVSAKREIYLRKRGADDPEAAELLESGALDALRMWVRTRPDLAPTYAVQMGFEVWSRDGRPMPECSGLVASPGGFPPGEAERGASAARDLARRVLHLYDARRPDAIPDHAMRDAFLFVQWRLAVLARHRANAADGRGETDLAMAETETADALDAKNGALARIHANMSWASKRRLERMTPQEGLRLGLARADFAFARTFATRVLIVSPDDPAAHFAIGMDFFVQEQYSRAEKHLRKCLEGRPEDPAVLNNLAQCRLRQGDPKEALELAEKALAVLPDSERIRRTVRRARDALAE